MSLLHSSPPPSSRYFLQQSTDPSILHGGHRISLPRASPINAIRSVVSLGLTSAVGSPPVELQRWSLGQKHIHVLNFAACAGLAIYCRYLGLRGYRDSTPRAIVLVAISTSWLFFSAIPTLLAVKKAAESMEKLLDVAAEELPDTMAAVRLSGKEISDLTMELSDIGQEITQGVRSSTRAVRLAEDRLRRLTAMAPTVSVQGGAPPRDETEGPALAITARNLREGIVKGRAALGVIFGITQFFRRALIFLSSRR